ncbi:MAG TPA: HEAT repeat domain-containing protein [Blastocatellia bacterium]|nr:HEAT repeat domain-containing protein [Blastocatellia bacterium]
MTSINLSEGDDHPIPPRNTPSRKYPWAILVVVVLFVVIPFIAWYGSWFGRPLSDAKMSEYLHDQIKPRNVQHALAQLGNRIIDGDQSVRQFYPDVVSSSHHQQAEVRMTAAWVMGQDNTNEDFHSALRPLLQDPSPGVRHNAALALVRFGDSSGRPELKAMLEPYSVHSQKAGVVELIIKEEGIAIAANGPLARVKQDDGNIVEIRAPEAARLESLIVVSGERIEAGKELMTLAPSTEQVWEALRALFIVGQPEDIPQVQRYNRPVSSLPDRIQKQAAATVEAIRGRASMVQ